MQQFSPPSEVQERLVQLCSLLWFSIPFKGRAVFQPCHVCVMNAGCFRTESGNSNATTYSGSTSSLMLQVAEQAAEDTYPAVHALAPCRLSPVALRGPLPLPAPGTSKVWTGRRPAAACSPWGDRATPWHWADPGHQHPRRRLQCGRQLSPTSLEGVRREVWGVDVIKCGRGWRTEYACGGEGGRRVGGLEPWSK